MRKKLEIALSEVNNAYPDFINGILLYTKDLDKDEEIVCFIKSNNNVTIESKKVLMELLLRMDLLVLGNLYLKNLKESLQMYNNYLIIIGLAKRSKTKIQWPKIIFLITKKIIIKIKNNNNSL